MSELRFDGRVALVTGAGRGMGRAHAKLLAARGAKVVVNDIGVMMDGSVGNATPAEVVVREITEAGGIAIADTHDVSSPDAVAAMVQGVVDAFGSIDIIVHNAGIVTWLPFKDMSYEQYCEIVNVHLDGGFLLAKAAWPHMVRQNYGRLIFITSQAALSGLANLTHYAVAKSGLTGLARAIGIEGEAHGIKANALGVTAYTRMMEHLFVPSDDDRPDKGLSEEAHVWWQNYMRAEQVSPAVAWLAHEDCFISGQTLDTGGGHVGYQRLVMTEGFAKVDLTPEDVRDNIQKILSPDHGQTHFPSAMHFMQWQNARVESGGAPPAPMR